ncbi:MAG: O-antigen ligase family protein [Patescibacteria group bacterium]
MLKKLLLLTPVFYFIVLPLVFCPIFYDRYELPKVIAFISVTTVLTGCVFTILSPKLNNVKFNILSVLLLVFSASLTTSSLLNFRQEVFLGQYYRYQGLVTLIAYLAFVWLFKQALDHVNLKLVGRIVAIGGTINALLILTQAIAFKILGLPIYQYNGRMTGLLGNPNFAGGFLVLSFVYSYFYLPTKPPWIRIIFYCLFFLAILATGSRSAILALLVTTILVFWKNRKLVVALGVTTLVTGLLLVSYRPSLIESRPIIWQKAIEAGVKKPIFGWGLENFDQAFQSVLKTNDFNLKDIRVDKAHNEFLEILVAGGLVGLSLYLALIGTTFNRLWQKRKEKWARVNLITLTAYLILGSLNVLNVTEYLFFYLILAQVFKVVGRDQSKLALRIVVLKLLKTT